MEPLLWGKYWPIPLEGKPRIIHICNIVKFPPLPEKQAAPLILQTGYTVKQDINTYLITYNQFKYFATFLNAMLGFVAINANRNRCTGAL